MQPPVLLSEAPLLKGFAVLFTFRLFLFVYSPPVLGAKKGPGRGGAQSPKSGPSIGGSKRTLRRGMWALYYRLCYFFFPLLFFWVFSLLGFFLLEESSSLSPVLDEAFSVGTLPWLGIWCARLAHQT
jgi:hypothetical protein